MKCNYHGIRTNCLKGIDLSFSANQVLFLGGPSGSGKSSLAVDTVHAISADELSQLMGLKDSVANYAIDDYSNILPSVCLQQENHNTNPRSIIATYFGLDRYFKRLFSDKNSVSPRLFQYNNAEHACPRCSGLGITLAPDPLKITDYSARIHDIPFRCWRNTDTEYYRQILINRCRELGISGEKFFKDLSGPMQNALLREQSDSRCTIKYTANSRVRRRTAPYTGPILELSLELEKGRLGHSRRKYFSEQPCRSCGGKRFSDEVLGYKLYGRDLGEIYLMEAGELDRWIWSNRAGWEKSELESSVFKAVLQFTDNMATLGVSYISLGRSIPSLSGGELQRLRLAKAISSHFSGFLFVLDEPTAGLHPIEWPMIARMIQGVKDRGNTVIIIEHNSFLRSVSDCCLYLGPGGGRNGGEFVRSPECSPCLSDLTNREYRFFESHESVAVRNVDYINIRKLSIDLPIGSLVGVCGVSGSGKSSFLRGVIPRVLDQATYLNQSPILGNSYSIVATAVNVLNKIQKVFSGSCCVDMSHFSFSSRGKGQCSACLGKGVIENESLYIASRIVCPECKGKRFSVASSKYRWNGMTIHELLAMDIESVLQVLPEKLADIRHVLNLLQSVGLGYLSLFRDTGTLSGGEAQRVKLVDSILERKRSEAYLLDEPFRGVDKTNAARMVDYFYDLVDHGKTIYLATHDPEVLSRCSYIIEFGPGGGSDGGNVIFVGPKSLMVKSSHSKMAKWIT